MKLLSTLLLFVCVASSGFGTMIGVPSQHDPYLLLYGRIRQITLPASTMVILELTEQVQSHKKKTGQLVNFRVRTDVKVDGCVVIRTGALATGKVKRILNEGSYNDPVEITLVVDNVQAVDGQMVALNGQEASFSPDFPNEPASVSPGEMLQANVMNDYEIKVKD